MNPLDNITDPYQFQQIVAEYFKSIKKLKKYHIDHIEVSNSGIGSDGGCDILVKFFYEDMISRHSHIWVIECKSQKQAVSDKHIRLNSIETILKTKQAVGYLLICRNDATSTLKKLFDDNNQTGANKYVIWNGSELWHKFIESKSLIKSFFPEYYQEYFIKNEAEKKYKNYISEFKKELEGGKKL